MDKAIKKPPKKRRENHFLSKSTVSDSANSDEDDEIIDYGNGNENGMDLSLDGYSESIVSEGGWSSEDDLLLVHRVKAISKANDRVSFRARLKKFDWHKVAFKDFSAKDCEERFTIHHMKQVRKQRNLNEIAVDIETAIKKSKLMKKPLNSYQLFIKDQLMKAESSGDFSEKMKNMAVMYNELTIEERTLYKDRARQLLNEYKLKKKESASSKNPNNTPGTAKAAESTSAEAKTPFMLYIDSQRPERNYNEMRDEYANMSIDQKYDWIKKAVELAPDDVKKVLTPKEERIYKGGLKPTETAYQLYLKDTYDKLKQTINNPPEIFSEIGQRWKKLDESKKQKYVEAAAALKQEAIKEQQEFNRRHGLVPPNRRKSTYVERSAIPESDGEENEEKPSITPKKRKLSQTNDNESVEDEPAEKKPNIRRRAQIKLPVKRQTKAQKAAALKQAEAKEQKELNECDSSVPLVQSDKESNVENSTSNDEAPTKQVTIRRKAQIKLPEKRPTKAEKLIADLTSTPSSSPPPSPPPNDNDGNESHVSNINEADTSNVNHVDESKSNKLDSQSELSDVNNDRVESEAASSSTSGMSFKKKAKKGKKAETVEPPGEKPPSSLFEYFARFIHTGKPRKAQKVFYKLSKPERKRLAIDYNEKVEAYVTNLKKYLASLPKEEAIAYIQKVKEMQSTKEGDEVNEKTGSQEY